VVRVNLNRRVYLVWQDHDVFHIRVCTGHLGSRGLLASVIGGPTNEPPSHTVRRFMKRRGLRRYSLPQRDTDSPTHRLD
jgi:hypothetical protein